MWKHEILERMQRKNISYYYEANELSHLLDALKSSQCFFVDNIDFIKDPHESKSGRHLFRGDLSIKSPGPYSPCLFIYGSSVKHKDNYLDRPFVSNKRAILFECSADEGIINAFCFCHIKQYDEWSIPFIGWQIDYRAGVSKPFRMCRDGDNFLKGVEISLREDIEEITALNSFLMLVECKNIKHETIPPNAKLNKSRVKKGKLPHFEYKILNVEMPGKKISFSSGGIKGNGTPQRVHLCRGHFKEYTPENPLFGRLVGRYWWQPTVRGKGEGIIEKEYHVKVAS